VGSRSRNGSISRKKEIESRLARLELAVAQLAAGLQTLAENLKAHVRQAELRQRYVDSVWEILDAAGLPGVTSDALVAALDSRGLKIQPPTTAPEESPDGDPGLVSP
jgi:hypothetical protein